MSIFSEHAKATDAVTASMAAARAVGEELRAIGVFTAVCRDKDGNVLWEDTFPNTVVTVGKNAMLDIPLAGAGYTVTGPFMGLISSVGYSAIAAGDTMASHAGWTEAGLANAPTYTAPRKTAAWSVAAGGAKSLSAGLVFAMTGAGTLKGGFLVFNTGAVSTIDDTNGTLFSAGLFTGGDQPVVATNTVTVSYTMTLT
jgi:hypothetical protein